MLPHHDQRTSENGDPAEHAKELLLLITTLCSHSALITVTFSTPCLFSTVAVLEHNAAEAPGMTKAGDWPLWLQIVVGVPNVVGKSGQSCHPHARAA